MSPGMWHWSCCCGGGGVGVGYLFAQHYNSRKPVVVTITNGGDISYDALDPTGFDAAYNTGAFPATCAVYSLMFMYRDNTTRVRVGHIGIAGVWGYAAATLDGASYTRPTFDNDDRIHEDPTGKIRAYLGNAHSESIGTSNVDYTDLGTIFAGYQYALDPTTWQRWQSCETINRIDGVDYYQAEMWKFPSGTAEILETYLDGSRFGARKAGALMDGRVWALWSGTPALRFYLRRGISDWTSVDMPHVATVLDAHTAQIGDTEVVVVLVRLQYNFVYPSSYDYSYYYYVIDTSTMSVTSSLVASTTAPEGMHYGAITSTEENVPCVVLTGDADGEQLTFYLGSGSSWTPYTTAHAGGFYRMTLSVAWQPYLGL